jgi:hypothetical protein
MRGTLLVGKRGGDGDAEDKGDEAREDMVVSGISEVSLPIPIPLQPGLAVVVYCLYAVVVSFRTIQASCCCDCECIRSSSGGVV